MTIPGDDLTNFQRTKNDVPTMSMKYSLPHFLPLTTAPKKRARLPTNDQRNTKTAWEPPTNDQRTVELTNHNRTKTFKFNPELPPKIPAGSTATWSWSPKVLRRCFLLTWLNKLLSAGSARPRSLWGSLATRSQETQDKCALHNSFARGSLPVRWRHSRGNQGCHNCSRTGAIQWHGFVSDVPVMGDAVVPNSKVTDVGNWKTHAARRLGDMVCATPLC